MRRAEDNEEGCDWFDCPLHPCHTKTQIKYSPMKGQNADMLSFAPVAPCLLKSSSSKGELQEGGEKSSGQIILP